MRTNRTTTGTSRRRLIRSVGGAAVATALAGCSSDSAGTPTTSPDDSDGQTSPSTDTQAQDSIPTGGTLNIATAGDPQNLDPHTTTINVAQLVLSNVVEGLFELDADMNLTGVLATGYEVSDDNRTYTISLKEGVTFHTGAEFTSADVRYSINRILDPDVGSPRAANFSLLESIETPDDYTVVFTLSEPFAPFMVSLTDTAAIIPEGSAEERNFQQEPVGTGQFVLDSWSTDDSVVLQRFDDYHVEDQPYLDTCEFNIIPEAATRQTQLQSGPAEVMFGVPFQQAGALESGSSTNLQSTSGLWKQALWFNTDREPLGDARVRRAISYAVNRQQLVQGVLFGHGQVANSPAPPTSAWRDRIDSGQSYEYSREQANSLLDEAGLDPGSISLSVKASRTPGTTYADTATLVQSHLTQLGMDVDVEIMDFSTWLQEAWVDKNYDLSIGSWSGRTDPDGWYYRQYHSEGAWNRFNYANDEVDQLLQDGRTTVDTDERADIYSQVDRIVSEELPMTYLYFREDMTGLTPSVGGYQLTPTSQAEFGTTYLEQ
ncbi:ABC transporter substrate-binding protein [Halorarum halobium]|uniref:ABC transporter substrate-binding protein n=1 Tax=Halorarum halobium TaxID=3075121 RepID=UPI0028A6E459|nr:ABC transporter substrate-binding protein [Halobaculum sp. XH14]